MDNLFLQCMPTISSSTRSGRIHPFFLSPSIVVPSLSSSPSNGLPSLHKMVPDRLRTVPNRRTVSVFCHIPARDRVIDVGKHKGRMLGTLPSKYLMWLSENLKGSRLDEWSTMAEEVLEDPVYRDRIEWEKVELAMEGRPRFATSVIRSESPGDYLIQIGNALGWDVDDQAGWSKINFSLLGTSKGGRIPRIQNKRNDLRSKPTKSKPGFRHSVSGGSVNGNSKENGDNESSELKSELLRRREARRERHKLRRNSRQIQLEQLPQSSSLGSNPFPGRKALLRKINGAG
eukprot:Gb_34652 [translate_table: standard]